MTTICMTELSGSIYFNISKLSCFLNIRIKWLITVSLVDDAIETNIASKSIENMYMIHI